MIENCFFPITLSYVLSKTCNIPMKFNEQISDHFPNFHGNALFHYHAFFLSEILKKGDFAIMTLVNLQIGNKYIYAKIF